jgi:hypothetical protein
LNSGGYGGLVLGMDTSKLESSTPAVRCRSNRGHSKLADSRCIAVRAKLDPG